MNLRSKKHRIGNEQGNDRDRLSELPDELLVHILSFLPIRDAVRTVLLRRFGKLWTLLRTLTYDQNTCSGRFICKVMTYHNSPTIDKLEIRKKFGSEKEEIMEFLDYGLRKKTKDLALCYNDYFSVPPIVFRNQSIVSLHLTKPSLNFTRKSQLHMGSLKKLELVYLCETDQRLQAWLSGCPCLQELVIKYPFRLKALHFPAPSIEKLELDFCLRMKSPVHNLRRERYTLDCPNLKILHINEMCLETLEVIDVSSVREAKITECCMTRGNFDYFDILLDKFRNAKLFQLGNKAYMQLQQCDSQKLDFQENRWTRLALRSVIEGSCLVGICRLLRNSRRLKELVIYADVDFSCNCSMLLHELSSPCLMQKLKTLTIYEYKKPCEGLLQLMKFLLRSAVALEKLVVVFVRKDQVTFLEEDDFILQLSSFPKASRKVSVAFIKEIR